RIFAVAGIDRETGDGEFAEIDRKAETERTDANAQCGAEPHGDVTADSERAERAAISHVVSEVSQLQHRDRLLDVIRKGLVKGMVLVRQGWQARLTEIH